MILLVSYDLKIPVRDYDSLYTTLKAAPGWWHNLDSTWILSTSESVETWGKRIRNVLDESDRFIIVDITGRRRYGWLAKEAWQWLLENDH